MKTILNLLSGILGVVIIFIILCDVSGLINSKLEPETIYGGLTFSIFLIWVSLKKNKTTTTETFFEKENIEIPIWWKRFIGFSIDFFIVVIICALVGAIITQSLILKIVEFSGPFILIFYPINFFYNFFNNLLGEFYGSIFLVFYPLFVFYYSLQEYFFKTSIGKSIFKLKVVSTIEDSQPSFFQILIRTLSKFFLGHINCWFFTVKKPIGLHDILSKTGVVYR